MHQCREPGINHLEYTELDRFERTGSYLGVVLAKNWWDWKVCYLRQTEEGGE